MTSKLHRTHDLLCRYRTPLHWAVLNGHIAATSALLGHGANANGLLNRKMTKGTHLLAEQPLHLACRLRSENAVEMCVLLFTHGADVNVLVCGACC